MAGEHVPASPPTRTGRDASIPGPDLTNTDTGLLPVLSPSTHQHQQHKPRTTIAAIPVNTTVTSRPSRLVTFSLFLSLSIDVSFAILVICLPFLSTLAVPGKKAALSTLFCSLVHFQTTVPLTYLALALPHPPYLVLILSVLDFPFIAVHSQSICTAPAALSSPQVICRLGSIQYHRSP
ncbi:hypothetical protein LY78DRAFT_347741 [Colletotrichum sublineola]|nr:hypothetical protein LY78DRAFT_347741 [Colletotrichum sublineola]